MLLLSHESLTFCCDLSIHHVVVSILGNKTAGFSEYLKTNPVLTAQTVDSSGIF